MRQEVYEVVIETRNIRTGQRYRQTYWRCNAPTVNTRPTYDDKVKGVPLLSPVPLLWVDTTIAFRAEADPEHDNEIGRYEE